jgi:uncharacterized membrane protein (DUF373 family)
MSKLDISLLQERVKQFYELVISLIFTVILLFITVIMIIGVARLFLQVGALFRSSGITGSYLDIFTDVLTLFVLIELSRSLAEYFTSRRLRLTPVIDAGILFVLRHVMIELFHHRLDTQSIYALSALLLALGLIRVGSSISFQRGRYLAAEPGPIPAAPVTPLKEP